VSGEAGDAPCVALWALDAARAEALIAALGAQGMRAVAWTASEPPPATLESRPVRAIVIAGDAQAAARLERSRMHASNASPAVPVMVIDVAQPELTPALIRAGAGDVALALALVGDDTLGRKLARMIRRGR
jgi:hypothetical protein